MLEKMTCTLIDRMDLKQMPLPKLAPILRKKAIIRDLSSSANQEIASAINSQIDLMVKYKAYSMQLQSLRARITNYRGRYRK